MPLNQNNNLAYWSEMFPEIADELKKLQKQISQQNKMLKIYQQDSETKSAQIKAQTNKLTEQAQRIKELTQLTNQQTKQIASLEHDLNIKENALVLVQLSDHDLWQFWHSFCDEYDHSYREPIPNAANSEARYTGYLTRPGYLKQFPLYLKGQLAKQKQKTELTNPENFDELEQRLLRLSFGALGPS